MGYSERETKAVVLACCISGFMTPLLSTMMNLSLVNIGIDFNVGSHSLAYVNSSFLLASVIFMVPFAKLGDIMGKKKQFVLGLLIMIVGCFVACLAVDFWMVILGRAIIGVGASALVTVSISMLTDVVPPEKRGTSIGFQTMFVYMGLSVGPALGGALNDIIGWRLLFLIVVPMALVSILVLLHGFKGDIKADPDGKLDMKGAFLYGIAVMLSMAGVMNLPQLWAIVSLVVGLMFLVLFIKSQIGNPNCLLEMRLFKNWMFSGSCLATFMSYGASFSMSFFLALYLQSIGQLTATEAGLVMITQPVVQCILTPVFGRLTDKIENKIILPTLGMAVTAIGLSTFLWYDLNTTITTVIITMLITGFGFSMFSAPNTTLIMSSVPREHTGAASGMVSVMRQTGMMVSMGIAMLFISVIMGSTDNLGPETYGLFLEVMKISFIVCIIMCAIGTVTSAFRGKPKPF